jgi:hypothetical protein
VDEARSLELSSQDYSSKIKKRFRYLSPEDDGPKNKKDSIMVSGDSPTSSEEEDWSVLPFPNKVCTSVHGLGLSLIISWICLV